MKLNFASALQDDDKPEVKAQSEHRIMLVDDELPNLSALSRRLARDFEVITCSSGKEALQQIDSEKPNSGFSVIITDQIMPEMSGVELLTELQKRQHPAPRIMLTGFAALENVVTAVNSAAIFRYLSKPVDIEKLLKAIQEAISSVEMRRENGRLVMMVKSLLESTAELKKQLPQAEQQLAYSFDSQFSPKRLEVVVVFADIRGFTSASKGADPEHVIASLDRIFQPMHGIIYQAGGIVDKHLGDGLMAIFGLSGGNATHAALMATKQMADMAEVILPRLTPPLHQLKIAFGVAAGTVIIGLMGSAHRYELAVIGETANFAARLQEFSKNSLLSPAGLNLLGRFDRSIALCSSNLLGQYDAFQPTNLNGEILIRDFPEVKNIGVYNPARGKP